MRTNSGYERHRSGGAADLGYGGYDDWTSVSQLPSDLNGSLTRTTCASPCRRTTGTITLWKTIWTSMPTRGSTQQRSCHDRDQCQPAAVAGHELLRPPHIHPFVPHVCGAYRRRRGYFKIQIISWYDANVEIGDEGGRISYYCDELK